MLIEQTIAVGGPVITGCSIAIVSLAQAGHGYEEAPSDEQEEEENSEQGETGSGVGSGSNYKQEEDSNSSQSEEAVAPLVWEGADGVLEEWCVRVDQVIESGMVVCRVRSSERLAHLIKADQYTQKLRSERVDWNVGLNARFQTVTETLVRAIACGSRTVVHSSDTLKTCYDLERVARDFRDTARTYGKVIISEVHLPVEAKTLRPLKLGGTLGGSKYVVRDVLFKLGNGDLFSEYPDPLYIANKIQGHELKGLKSYFGWFFNKGTLGLVSFPLMALIDFKGHRITAMSELPICGAETLILGSMNAGGECNVENKDQALSNLVNTASAALGLKPHFVTNGKSAGGETEITCCVDLEGHRGKDGKKYLLDFSRTFPPVFKPSEERQDFDKLWPFYSMFRAEFLLRYKVFTLLSPDAYSNFQSPLRPEEKNQNHADIRQATEFLKTQVVHNVCVSLSTSVSEVGEGPRSLSHTFHREGLNVRYLGLVYELLATKFYSEHVKCVLKEVIAEALTRVLKNHVRGLWRAADGESNQLDATRDCFNAFFGKSRNEEQWLARNPYVMPGLISKFLFSPKNAKFAVITFRTGSFIEQSGGALTSIKFVVLKRVTEDTGLVVDAEVMQDLGMGGGSMRGRAFETETVFDGLDFSFTERVKQLDIVQRAFGLAQYLKGMQMIQENPVAAEQFLLRGFFMVEKVLEASPLDPWLTALMGDLSCGLWMIMNAQCSKREAAAVTGKASVSAAETSAIAEQREVCNIFLKRADKYYHEALSANPIVSVLRNYSIFLLRCMRLSEAEQHLKLALENCNDEGGTLNGQLVSEWELVGELMDLLKECHDLRASGQIRRSSVQMTPSEVPAASASMPEKKKKDSVVSKLGISLRKSSKADTCAPNVKVARNKSGSLSPTNRRESGSSGGSGNGGAGNGGVGGGGSVQKKSSQMAVDKLKDSMSNANLTSMLEAEDGVASAEGLRLANERNKLLLARLRGKN